MRKYWALSLLCVLLLAGQALAGPLVVTGTTATATDASNLVGLLINTPTVTYSNATLTGVVNQQGTFTGGTGILPFDTGVMLTSGSVYNAPGPNTVSNVTTNVGTGGDADLNGLIPGYSTYDANVLEFDFVPTNNVVSFQFVFASDEYDEYVNSAYNDVFGFFLNGTNIAVIPSTNPPVPVSINNVNCNSHFAYYNDNGSGTVAFGPACSGTGVNLQYDGIVGGLYSTLLYATGPVTPGQTNHIKLAIADSGDHILDSAVFLAGGSFKDQQPPAVPEPATMVLTASGLIAVLRKKFRA